MKSENVQLNVKVDDLLSAVSKLHKDAIDLQHIKRRKLVYEVIKRICKVIQIDIDSFDISLLPANF